MSEEQASFSLQGEPGRPTTAVSLRAGRARYRHDGAGGQRASARPPGAATRRAMERLRARLIGHLARFAGLDARVKAHGLIRSRQVAGVPSYRQCYDGYWGNLTVPGAWDTAFGGVGEGAPVFRRGPWEDWPRDLPTMARVDPAVPLILSPYCGTLLHEAVGHAMEAEYWPHSPLNAWMGRQVATEDLTLMDRPDLDGLPGSMSHDDTGAAATATTLIHRGFLVGGLEAGKGMWRRATFRDLPQIRATNFLVKPGGADPAAWLRGPREAFYVAWIRTGNWLPGSHRIKVLTGPVFHLRDGEAVAHLPWTYLAFQTLDLLARIEAVGNDFRMDPVVHWCMKRHQAVPIGLGMPSVLIGGGLP